MSRHTISKPVSLYGGLITLDKLYYKETKPEIKHTLHDYDYFICSGNHYLPLELDRENNRFIFGKQSYSSRKLKEALESEESWYICCKNRSKSDSSYMPWVRSTVRSLDFNIENFDVRVTKKEYDDEWTQDVKIYSSNAYVRIMHEEKVQEGSSVTTDCTFSRGTISSTLLTEWMAFQLMKSALPADYQALQINDRTFLVDRAQRIFYIKDENKLQAMQDIIQQNTLTPECYYLKESERLRGRDVIKNLSKLDRWFRDTYEIGGL